MKYKVYRSKPKIFIKISHQYKIPFQGKTKVNVICCDCGVFYIGQRDRSNKIRFFKHVNIPNKNNLSTVAEHILNKAHYIRIKNLELYIQKESNAHLWKLCIFTNANIETYSTSTKDY